MPVVDASDDEKSGSYWCRLLESLSLFLSSLSSFIRCWLARSTLCVFCGALSLSLANSHRQRQRQSQRQQQRRRRRPEQARTQHTEQCPPSFPRPLAANPTLLAPARAARTQRTGAAVAAAAFAFAATTAAAAADRTISCAAAAMAALHDVVVVDARSLAPHSTRCSCFGAPFKKGTSGGGEKRDRRSPPAGCSRENGRRKVRIVGFTAKCKAAAAFFLLLPLHLMLLLPLPLLLLAFLLFSSDEGTSANCESADQGPATMTLTLGCRCCCGCCCCEHSVTQRDSRNTLPADDGDDHCQPTRERTRLSSASLSIHPYIGRDFQPSSADFRTIRGQSSRSSRGSLLQLHRTPFVTRLVRAIQAASHPNPCCAAATSAIRPLLPPLPPLARGRTLPKLWLQ